MATLQEAKDEILAVCEKYGVKLEPMFNNIVEEIWIEVVYKGDDLIGSTRLYNKEG